MFADMARSLFEKSGLGEVVMCGDRISNNQFLGHLFAVITAFCGIFSVTVPISATVITLDENGSYIVQTGNTNTDNTVSDDVIVFKDKRENASVSESEKRAFMELLKHAPKGENLHVKKPSISKNNKQGADKTNIRLLVKKALKNHGNLTEGIVHAVIAAESSYNPDAISHKGAQGLMQLMPATAARYGLTNAFDPEQNIMAGVAELSRLMKKYDNLALALAAYNAGEQAVKKHSGIPPYKETEAYVARIMKDVIRQQELRLQELREGIALKQNK